jgi:hypothetical protein
MVTTRCKDPSWVLHQWRLRPRKRGARRMAADEAAGEDVEESSMLLEAKRQISHIGDVANIAMFVKMLKIAKEALVGALRSSTGKPSGISENLVMELSLVNPLSEVRVCWRLGIQYIEHARSLSRLTLTNSPVKN